MFFVVISRYLNLIELLSGRVSFAVWQIFWPETEFGSDPIPSLELVFDKINNKKCAAVSRLRKRLVFYKCAPFASTGFFNLGNDDELFGFSRQSVRVCVPFRFWWGCTPLRLGLERRNASSLAAGVHSSGSGRFNQRPIGLNSSEAGEGEVKRRKASPLLLGPVGKTNQKKKSGGEKVRGPASSSTGVCSQSTDVAPELRIVDEPRFSFWQAKRGQPLQSILGGCCRPQRPSQPLGRRNNKHNNLWRQVLFLAWQQSPLTLSSR